MYPQDLGSFFRRAFNVSPRAFNVSPRAFNVSPQSFPAFWLTESPHSRTQEPRDHTIKIPPGKEDFQFMKTSLCQAARNSPTCTLSQNGYGTNRVGKSECRAGPSTNNIHNRTQTFSNHRKHTKPANKRHKNTPQHTQHTATHNT